MIHLNSRTFTVDNKFDHYDGTIIPNGRCEKILESGFRKGKVCLRKVNKNGCELHKIKSYKFSKKSTSDKSTQTESKID
jgi:hypothetical protein